MLLCTYFLYYVLLFFIMNINFPSVSVKNLLANAGDMCSIPGSGRSHGGGNGNPLHYYCLRNPMYREAWWATDHGITKSQTQLSN